MDLGMPTLQELNSLEENAALCAEWGLSFVEVNMNLPDCQPDVLNADMLQRIGKKYGIYFTFHMDENFDPCNFNPAVADAYRKTMLHVVELAKTAKIPLINMHMNHGVYFTLPDEKVYLYEKYRDHYLDRLKELCSECESKIGDNEMLICVENTDGFKAFEYEALQKLLESKKFGLTLDIGHAHTAGYPDHSFYQGYLAQLRHIHCHDAKEKRNHLPLGSGDVELSKIFLLAKENDCRIVIEVKAVEELRESIDFLRNGGIPDAHD